jgi:hypothetical protein
LITIEARTTSTVAPRSTLNFLEAKLLAEPDIWYVSYRSNIAPRRENGERSVVRATRKFKTEADARQFAREIIEKGWSAIAGTLNPHTPKKTVSSRRILDWIAGKDC